MRNEADNEKLLMEYLLGRLSEQEQLQIEEMFFNNDQYYERLLAIENELFYDYVQGKLLPGDRKLFEKRFLISGRDQRRITLASALIDKISEKMPAEIAQPNVAEQGPKRRWQSLKSFLDIRQTGVRVSLTVLAVVLLGSIWLVGEIFKLRTELSQLRAARTAQEESLQRAQQERARIEALNLNLQRELNENETLKQELSKLQTHPDQEPQNFQATLSLILSPSFVRGGANSLKRLNILPETRFIKLQLNIKGDAEYKLYQATLLTAEGVERWSKDLLRPQRIGSVQTIILKLPAKVLEDGDYELRLKGLASDGTLEETGDYYYFSITKK